MAAMVGRHSEVKSSPRIQQDRLLRQTVILTFFGGGPLKSFYVHIK